jgi:hypothetical protein
MLHFVIDNIFVLFGGRLFQQMFGNLTGTNYAPLLADLSLHVYESDFLQRLLRIKNSKLAQNFTSACDSASHHSVTEYIGGMCACLRI